jgi:hypothetical protein
MTESSETTTPQQNEAWIGRETYEFWTHLIQWIEQNYPNIFTPDWLFKDKKHGWSLRYKKRKSFCTLITKKGRFAIQTVFGSEERAKVEAIRTELSVQTWNNYETTTTYHDGKWLLLTVDSDNVENDIEQLLT